MLFPARDPLADSPPTWAGDTPMTWTLALAGGVLLVLTIAAVL